MQKQSGRTRTLSAMRARCYNPKTRAYKNYGGRGITVCSRWEHFVYFLEDMGPRPSPKHSIERKDNNGNYEPDNCYWATKAEQERNTRRNRNLTFKGETMCLSDWAARIGLERNTLLYRLRRWGWDNVEKALTTAIVRHINRAPNGTFKSV